MNIVFPLVANTTGDRRYFNLLAEELKKNNCVVKIIDVSRWAEFGFLKRRKLLSQLSEYDLIHANADYGGLFKLKGTPLVLTAHHNVNDAVYNPHKNTLKHIYHRTWFRYLQKKGFALADAVIYPSVYTAKSFQREYPQYAEKGQVIVNGIDMPDYGHNVHNRVKGQILVVGTPSRRKGADLWGDIMQELPGYNLLCVGAEGLSKSNIHFLGRVGEEELTNLYRQSEMLLSTSRLEGFGYTLVEAISQGCPVVCSGNSALAELFADSEFGVKARDCTAESFVDAIRGLSLNMACKANVQSYGYTYVRDHYSSEKWCEEILQCYRRVLDEF